MTSTNQPLASMNHAQQGLPAFPNTSPGGPHEWKRAPTILAVTVFIASVPIAAAAESEGRHHDLEVKPLEKARRHCVHLRGTMPLARDVSHKDYAPGAGIVKNADFELAERPHAIR